MTDSKLRRTSGPERTLTQRELAAMRPAAAVARRRQPSGIPALREVTSGIVCFCGERFGENQALEFMLHLRKEVGEDLAQLESYRAAQREYSRRYREKYPDRIQERYRKIRDQGKLAEYNRRYIEKLGRDEYNRRRRERRRQAIAESASLRSAPAAGPARSGA